MRRHRAPAWRLLALLALAGCERASGPELRLAPLPHGSPLCPDLPAAAAAPELAPGEGPAEHLAAGAMDLHALSLRHGEFFSVAASQAGADLVLCLYDEQGRLLLPVDRPTGGEEAEELAAIAPQAGRFLLGVRAFDPEREGGYQLQTEIEPRPDERRRRRAEASTATALAEQAWRAGEREGAVVAARLFARALANVQALGDPRGEGDVAYRLGRLERLVLHDPAAALVHLERACPLAQAHAGPLARAQACGELGQAQVALGRAAESLPHLAAAEALYRQLGEPGWAAVMVQEQATAYQLLGRVQEALDGYGAVLTIFRSLGASAEAATALHNRAVLLATLGRREEAKADYRAALALRAGLAAERAAPQGQVKTLTALGSLELEGGDLAAARELFSAALSLNRELGDLAGEAVTLGYLGLLDERRGDLRAALLHHREAVGRSAGAGDGCLHARALAQLGDAETDAGLASAARQSYSAAMAAVLRCDDALLVARVRFGSARAKQRSGDPAAAWEDLEAALALTEELREAPLSRNLRATFLAGKQDYYDLGVELLLELAARAPAASYGRQALELAERARARSLLDLIREGGGTLRRRVPEALAARLRELTDAIRRQHERQSAEGPGAAAGLDPGRGEPLRSLLAELDRLETEIRQASPEPSTLAGAEPLSYDRIERELLEPGTLVLNYRLGRRQSVLWALEPGRFETFRLEPSEVLEPLLLRAHRLLARGDPELAGVQLALTLELLAKDLLGPVQHLLGRKRLVIVGGGALELLPFAVLPSPAGTGRPLLLDHEIVVEPSLSVLAALERESRGRRPAPRALALFADPVYSARDERVPAGLRQAAAAGTYERLPASRREAEAIAALLPAGQALLRLGFEARRENFLSERLASFRELHFAVHSAANSEHPELSRLVLSLIDEAGNPLAGEVFAHEIHHLHLPADLVVLSSCDSGLGADVRGEGLVGLPHAFFDAGATRVISSLWQVGDAATASLMTRFYRHHVAGGLPPAAALRQAQIEEREVSPWPHTWGAFVVQGPWR